MLWTTRPSAGTRDPALQRQAVPTAHALREGEEHEIPLAELVPGDVVLVAAEQPRAWHTLSAEEVTRALQTDPTSGLTNAEAAGRSKQFGPNARPG